MHLAVFYSLIAVPWSVYLPSAANAQFNRELSEKEVENDYDIDWYENDVADEMEKKIKGWMEQFNRDLGCFTFVHVPKEELATHTTFKNGILFVPASITNGKSWSTLGVGNGFVGEEWRENSNNKMEQLREAGITILGAPADWQIISLQMIGYNQRTVQHEGLDLESQPNPKH